MQPLSVLQGLLRSTFGCFGSDFANHQLIVQRPANHQPIIQRPDSSRCQQQHPVRRWCFLRSTGHPVALSTAHHSIRAAPSAGVARSPGGFQGFGPGICGGLPAVRCGVAGACIITPQTPAHPADPQHSTSRARRCTWDELAATASVSRELLATFSVKAGSCCSCRSCSAHAGRASEGAGSGSQVQFCLMQSRQRRFTGATSLALCSRLAILIQPL